MSAPANTVDHILVTVTLDAIKDFQPLPARVTVHLDAGGGHRPARQALADRGLLGQIAHRGAPAPLPVGRRWVVERTHAWFNGFGRLRRCTERRRDCVEAYLCLAAAIVTIRALRRAAWYRSAGTPIVITTHPLPTGGRSNQLEFMLLPYLVVSGQWLTVDSAVLYHVLRYYHAHPEARAELATDVGLQRIRSGSTVDHLCSAKAYFVQRVTWTDGEKEIEAAAPRC